jgi:hypothetical protein
MSDLAPPSWVSKRDGRLVPFEADRIRRALFAASESLGQPSVFRSCELTESIVHFLALDSEGQIPTTQRIAEVVEQVLRQLGQHDLATAFVRHRQRQATSRHRPVTLLSLYTPDLSAAEREGLIQLEGAETAGQLTGCVVTGRDWALGNLEAALEQASAVAGRFVALEGLEQLPEGVDPVRVRTALQATALRAVVNLNGLQPDEATRQAGSLFAGLAAPRRASSLEWLQGLLGSSSFPGRIDWHLGSSDFSESSRQQLPDLVRTALTWPEMTFVFDRPRRPVALAEGLDRDHVAVLGVVALHLPTLAAQGGLLADWQAYLQRLGSLARLALSAAVQKRDFIRMKERQRLADEASTSNLLSGFLLDRARLVVVPVGLDEVVRQFTGWGLANGGPSLELGCLLIRQLREVLERQGRLVQLEVCVDSPVEGSIGERRAVAGLTPWDATASLKSQLQAGSALHAAAGAGTLTLFVPPGEEADLPELLEQAWRQTEIVRLRLQRPIAT